MSRHPFVDARVAELEACKELTTSELRELQALKDTTNNRLWNVITIRVYPDCRGRACSCTHTFTVRACIHQVEPTLRADVEFRSIRRVIWSIRPAKDLPPRHPTPPEALDL